jgi:hypothetical protein
LSEVFTLEFSISKLAIIRLSVIRTPEFASSKSKAIISGFYSSKMFCTPTSIYASLIISESNILEPSSGFSSYSSRIIELLDLVSGRSSMKF